MLPLILSVQLFATTISDAPIIDAPTVVVRREDDNPFTSNPILSGVALFWLIKEGVQLFKGKLETEDKQSSALVQNLIGQNERLIKSNDDGFAKLDNTIQHMQAAVIEAGRTTNQQVQDNSKSIMSIYTSIIERMKTIDDKVDSLHERLDNFGNVVNKELKE